MKEKNDEIKETPEEEEVIVFEDCEDTEGRNLLLV